MSDPVLDFVYLTYRDKFLSEGSHGPVRSGSAQTKPALIERRTKRQTPVFPELEKTAEASNNDVDPLPETDSFIYNPSFASSEASSITSYKTERTINSRKSRYNALPRHKYADIGPLRHLQDLMSLEVDGASASKV